MITLADIAVGAGGEDRISSEATTLARRSEEADISGIRNELRICIRGYVPLDLARAGRRAILDSAYIIGRGVSEARVYIGLLGDLLDLLRIDDVADVYTTYCAGDLGLLTDDLRTDYRVVVRCRIYRYSIDALEDGFRDSDLASTTDYAYCGNDFAYWWSRFFLVWLVVDLL